MKLLKKLTLWLLAWSSIAVCGEPAPESWFIPTPKTLKRTKAVSFKGSEYRLIDHAGVAPEKQGISGLKQDIWKNLIRIRNIILLIFVKTISGLRLPVNPESCAVCRVYGLFFRRRSLKSDRMEPRFCPGFP